MVAVNFGNPSELKKILVNTNSVSDFSKFLVRMPRRPFSGGVWRCHGIKDTEVIIFSRPVICQATVCFSKCCHFCIMIWRFVGRTSLEASEFSQFGPGTWNCKAKTACGAAWSVEAVTSLFDVQLYHRGFTILHGRNIPSRELTYPPKMAFWRWFSFCPGGIC